MRFTTSEKEKKDIIKAWIAISIAFAIALNGLRSGFSQAFIIAALTVGVGFLLHELAHKLVAQHYGCWAEFRSFDQMLFFAILLSFTGIIFAAPGAVMISGHVTNDRNGKISAAGPITNFILALLFIPLLTFPVPIIQTIGQYGFMINAWLGLFNMIPLGNFDGIKILRWNSKIYGLMVAVGFILLFGQSLF